MTDDYPEDALSFEAAEAIGLDGTGRDMATSQEAVDHFPYRYSDPWVQERIEIALSALAAIEEWIARVPARPHFPTEVEP